MATYAQLAPEPHVDKSRPVLNFNQETRQESRVGRRIALRSQKNLNFLSFALGKRENSEPEASELRLCSHEC